MSDETVSVPNETADSPTAPAAPEAPMQVDQTLQATVLAKRAAIYVYWVAGLSLANTVALGWTSVDRSFILGLSSTILASVWFPPIAAVVITVIIGGALAAFARVASGGKLWAAGCCLGLYVLDMLVTVWLLTRGISMWIDLVVHLVVGYLLLGSFLALRRARAAAAIA